MTTPVLASSAERKRQFAAACAGMFMFGIVLALLGALFGLPQFRQRLGLDLVQQGTVLSLLYVGVLFATPLVGPIIDRFGNRLVLVASAALVTAALGLFVAARSFPAAAVAGLLLGFGGGGLNIAANSLVSDIFGESRGPMLNYLGIFYGMGGLFIPILAATLSTWFTPPQLILFALALAGACTLAYSGLRFPPPREAHGFAWREALHVAQYPGVLLFALVLFVESGDEAVITGWTSTYAGSLGYGARNATLTLTAYLAGLMLGRVAAAWVLAHTSKWRLVFASACASLFGYGLLVWVHSLLLLWLSAALVGVCFAAVYPTTLAMVGDRYRRFAASVFSFVFTLAMAGGIIAPWLVGKIATGFGLRYGMLVPLLGRIMLIILLLVVAASERRAAHTSIRSS